MLVGENVMDLDDDEYTNGENRQQGTFGFNHHMLNSLIFAQAPFLY